LSYTNFMLIFFINMMILISMSSLLFVNIIMNNCPSIGFHTILMLILTCYHITNHNYGLWIIRRFWWCLCSCEYKWLVCHDWNKATTSLCVEFSPRFLNVEIMSTLSMVYSKNWLCEENATRKFFPHLD